ncbi:protein trichome birefringence-like 19 [Syzygium oleosum]|uniref:protein trichome birefringence-like 19 n=1 Tax=Syzygium oleosum TaxID=219896 RepID=UPI0024B8C19A|nr:protein trichome birefringence-like 19 [Syzygium oleosum]
MTVALSEEHHGNKKAVQQSATVNFRRVLALAPTTILLTVIPLWLLFVSSPVQPRDYPPACSIEDKNGGHEGKDEAAVVPVPVPVVREKKCDVFKGKWVYRPDTPTYYTNETCYEISDQQNCMKFGRPDTEFLKWRWQPDGCELPPFDAAEFMEMARGKSIAFVGDSLGRNHMQSLLCLLSSVDQPEDISLRYSTDYNFKRWYFPNHNLTLATFWAPFLVRTTDAGGGQTLNGVLSLHLDEPHPAWSSEIGAFHHVIVSAGQWFFRALVYYQNGRLLGCSACGRDNMTEVSRFRAYRTALRTTLNAIMGMKNREGGITFLRTFSPAHFENGDWTDGGSCTRTRPFKTDEKKLEGYDLEFYLAQVEEFLEAERRAREEGMKIRLLDTTRSMLLRPDGHPNRQCNWPKSNVGRADCVHWCLPGPIDTWNEFLFHVMKSEKGVKFTQRKLQSA